MPDTWLNIVSEVRSHVIAPSWQPLLHLDEVPDLHIWLQSVLVAIDWLTEARLLLIGGLIVNDLLLWRLFNQRHAGSMVTIFVSCSCAMRLILRKPLTDGLSKLRVLALRVRDARWFRDRVPHCLLYWLLWLITKPKWLSCVDYRRVGFFYFLAVRCQARRRHKLLLSALFLLLELEPLLLLLLVFLFLVILTFLSSDCFFYVGVSEGGQ